MIRTWPWTVNLTALPTRLTSSCRSAGIGQDRLRHAVVPAVFQGEALFASRKRGAPKPRRPGSAAASMARARFPAFPTRSSKGQARRRSGPAGARRWYGSGSRYSCRLASSPSSPPICRRSAKPRMTFSGVRISWPCWPGIHSCAVGVLGHVAGVFQGGVGLLPLGDLVAQLGRASQHPLFQFVLGRLQRRFRGLDVIEHQIERHVQAAELVVGVPTGTHAVVALFGDSPGRFRQIEDRPGNELLHAAREEDHDVQREDHDEERDFSVVLELCP